MFKKATIFMLIVCMLISTIAPISAAVAEEPVTVEDMLEALENGEATEVMEVIDLDELTEEEIAADPILAQIIENSRNTFAPRSSYNQYAYGVLYTSTITDGPGNTLKYYSRPMARNFYVDVSHSGGSSEFASRFYVDEYITMNGSVVTGYINRIKYKNVRGWIGLGPNICFGETINISKAASVPISVNFLGLIGSFLPAKYTTTKAIISALNAIDFTSQCSSSYSLTSSRSGIGCKFSGVTLDEDEEFVKISSFVSTVNSSQATNVLVPVVFKWTYDVYKGTSKYSYTGRDENIGNDDGSYNLIGKYEVYANYTG